MKRLIDEDHEANSADALLAGLVHASTLREQAPMDPQRVLRAIVAPPRTPRFGGVSLGSAAAALTIAAVAAASVGTAIVVSKRHVREVPIAARAAEVPEGPSAVSLPPVIPLPAATSEVMAPSKSADTPSARLRSPSRSGSLRDGEDPTPVLEAIRALRENGDAARAGDLLAGYLRSHPRGVLAEDALALSIEAAIARHDTKAAAELGRRYLARFPNGRFRAFAQRAGRSP